MVSLEPNKQIFVGKNSNHKIQKPSLYFQVLNGPMKRDHAYSLFMEYNIFFFQEKCNSLLYVIYKSLQYIIGCVCLCVYV